MSASTAALAILAGGLAGCSGGGASSVSPIPQNAPAAPAAAQRTTETVAAVTVDPSAASAVAALTSNSHAHAFPMRGVGTQSNARHAMTGGYYDLSYYGGPYLKTVASNNIYVNCGNSCWGTSPYQFEINYGASSMIHIVDQYVGTTANGRYTAGNSMTENYNTSGTLQDADIYNLIHTAAQSQGGGYGHIYHVFLQSGVHQCSSSAGGCYAVQYCAYHGSTDFSDVGHVVYSVEPYQGISGCSVGSLTNSTSSTLSHELTEAITDVDVAQNNLAWYNNAGGEIGDICAGNNGNVTLNGVSYYIQSEYSNKYSACRWSP